MNRRSALARLGGMVAGALGAAFARRDEAPPVVTSGLAQVGSDVADTSATATITTTADGGGVLWVSHDAHWITLPNGTTTIRLPNGNG